MQYARNNMDFRRGTFRARGDVIEVFPAYEDDRVLRIELFGDEIDALVIVDPLKGEVLEELQRLVVYPANHYVTPPSACTRPSKGSRSSWASGWSS
jgi:excinuclease ABC subunit B